jgi:small conductance mechanosensitive channel
MIEEFARQIAQFAPNFALGLLILAAFGGASVVLQKLIRRLGGQRELTSDVLRLLEQTVKTALWIFGGVTALGTMGVNVSALVAGLGLTGFALGFAFRDILSNLLAGALILSYRPFQRHDRIAVMGFEGAVIEIGLRYTVLRADGKKILIPNANLFTNPVIVLEKPSSSGDRA